MTEPALRMGTRASTLARWQTNHVADLLRQAWPQLTIQVEIFSTRGDRVLDTPLPLVGGKGLFTAELEAALRTGAIDCAVHSLKDLPTDDPDGLTVGATPLRANPQDALISKHNLTLDQLPLGAVIGTSSLRRAAQLRALRPDLQIMDIRGNVETRMAKVLDPDSPYHATILACAGLDRLGLLDRAAQILPLAIMLPAPGQGALGVQCRDEAESRAFLAPLDDPATRAAVTAERAFLSGLGGGCAVPIAAFAHITQADDLHLIGRISAVDGGRQIEVAGRAKLGGNLEDAYFLGSSLAAEALDAGAAQILRSAP